MQRHGLDQQLNRAPLLAAWRKVIDLFHFKSLPAKTGISIFSSTLVVGTGVMLVSAQTGPSSAGSTQTPQTTSATHTDFGATESTTDSLSESQASNSNSSNSGQSGVSDKTSASSNVQTDITLNGKTVTVPANGSVHQTVTSNDGLTTNLNVTSRTSTQEGTSSHVIVHTNSSSSQSGASN